MQNENYSLVINSSTDTSIITNNIYLYAYQYNINWQSILPVKYKRFTVTFQCKSANVHNVGFAGSQTGGVLTVSSVFSNRIYIGMQYFNANSIITITSLGTGTGLAGTYNIDNNTTVTNTLLYSTNTLLTSNVICSINFGSNNTVENNSASNKLGALYPYTYPLITPNVYTSNIGCGVQDNGPTEIIYPTNNNITVSFTNIDGTPLIHMTDYNLQLYFTPIE
jgi:hypothetical protein